MTLLSNISMPFGQHRGTAIRHLPDSYLEWATSSEGLVGKSWVPSLVQAGLRAEWAARRPPVGKLSICGGCGKTTDDPAPSSLRAGSARCRKCWATGGVIG